jgi:hypothetical protein
MELRCNADKKEKICLLFFPCEDKGEKITWEEWHKVEPLVVYDTDWDLLLSHFYKVFPITDPTNAFGEIQDSFDHCFDNWIGKNDWLRIIKSIKNNLNSIEIEKEIQFFNKFICWIEKQLDWADIIVIDSNL